MHIKAFYTLAYINAVMIKLASIFVNDWEKKKLFVYCYVCVRKSQFRLFYFRFKLNNVFFFFKNTGNDGLITKLFYAELFK